MRCPECHDAIQTLLDGEAVDRQTLAAHAKICESCRGQLEACERMLEAICAQSAPVLPSEFSQRVQAAWQRRQVVFRRWRFASIGLAASLLVGLLIAGWIITTPRSNQEMVRDDGVSTEPKRPDPPPQAPPSRLRRPINHAGQSFVSFSNQFTSSMSRQARPLFAQFPEPSSPITPPPVRNVGKTITVSVEPVLDSARGAFDVLSGLFPTDPPEHKPPK